MDDRKNERSAGIEIADLFLDKIWKMRTVRHKRQAEPLRRQTPRDEGGGKGNLSRENVSMNKLVV